jgi:Flp pilus assembly pilin Flp
MRSIKNKSLKTFIEDESGQAMLEYILLVGSAIGLVAMLKTSLNEMTGKLWKMLAKRIAAGCAGCSTEEDLTF